MLNIAEGFTVIYAHMKEQIAMLKKARVALRKVRSTDLKERKRGGHAQHVILAVHLHQAIIALAWQQLRLDVHVGLPREASRVQTPVI